MALSWKRDVPTWDEDKQRIIGSAPAGIFDTRYAQNKIGATVPCDWYRVEDDGRTVGYGWLDVVWGDAEILLATDPEYRDKGVGTFILENIDKQARRMGVNYIYNVVRPTHPDGDKVRAWLEKRGFHTEPDGRLTRRVGAAS
jgi:N-acetylglutamate synthase-like GNAT family acetyltransferase